MIISIIGLACAAHLVADFGMHVGLPQKPFQCDMCMGFWIGMPVLTLAYGWEGLMAAPIVGVLADVIYRLKEKL